MPRLFLALPLSWEIKQIIADAAEEIKKQMKFSQVNWVDLDQYHITLHFLDEVSEEKENKLIEKLKEKDLPQPFELKISELTAFPNKKQPQIICLKTNIHPSAFGLYKRTGDVCASLGLPVSERSWEPHITIGRVKVQSEVLKPELIKVPSMVFQVNSFVLMMSTLGPGGSKYDTIEEFRL